MGLVVDVQEDYSNTITQGIVIRYSPMEGVMVEKGDTVTIVVSKGPETPKITVPDLINTKLEDVKLQLDRVGLTLRSVEEFPSEKYAEGFVIWQSIEPYKEVDKGTEIDLWVSTGPSAAASEEPSAEPSDEPPASDDPVPSDGYAVATKPITASLSGYEGSVHLRIVVGDMTLFDGAVDADMNTSKTVYHTASGTQYVCIYINGDLRYSYYEVFT